MLRSPLYTFPHKQSEEALATAGLQSDRNKVVKKELDALKAQLTAMKLSQSEQSERNKTLVDELNTLKAKGEEANTVAQENEALQEELEALKAELEAVYVHHKKLSGVNQALREEIQLLRVECAAKATHQQLDNYMVYL